VEGAARAKPEEWGYWLTSWVQTEGQRGYPSEPTPHTIYQRWEGPVMVADEQPGQTTFWRGHGLYALKPGHLADLPCVQRSWYGDQLGWCVGTVGLFGKVVEGTDGYRAEKAVIRSLWLATPYLWVANTGLPALLILRKLAERYDLADQQCHVGLPPEVEELMT
jgi:hypothetical protein